MPQFLLPALSNSVFHDGTPIQANDICVPVQLVIDCRGKIKTYRGDPVVMQDVTPPELSNFAVTSNITETTVELVWDAVVDNVDLAPDVIIAAYSSASSPTPSNVYYGGGAGFVSKAEIPDGYSTAAYVYGSGAFGEPPLVVDNTYYFYAVALDTASNMSSVVSAFATTPDQTPPAFSNFSYTSNISDTTIELRWDVFDIVDPQPSVTIAVFAAPQSPSSQDVTTGAGAISKVTISDAYNNNVYIYGTGTFGEPPLDQDAELYFYAVATDASGNLSAVPLHTIGVTEDGSPPAVSNLAASNATFTTIDLTWDAVIDNSDQTPDVFISVYGSPAASPTSSDVLSGQGDGFVSKIHILDGRNTTQYTYGSGIFGEGPLSIDTSYYFFAVSMDLTSNVSLTPTQAVGTTATPVLPAFDVIDITSSSAGIGVVWDVTDTPFVTNTVHIVNTCNEIDVVTASNVKHHPHVLSVAEDSGSVTLSNVALNEDSYVYAVVEDDVSVFGAPSNQFSDVSSNIFGVPLLVSSLLFTQDSDYFVSTSKFIVKDAGTDLSLDFVNFKSGLKPETTVDVVEQVEESPCNLQSVSILDEEPPHFANLYASDSNDYSVTLSWDEITDNGDPAPSLVLTAYLGGSLVDGLTLSNVSGITSHTFEGLQPLTEYSFYGQAHDSAQNFTPILSVTATTPDLTPPAFSTSPPPAT